MSANTDKSDADGPYRRVAPNEAYSMIHWPLNSVGYAEEKRSIDTLLALVKVHGYGGLAQMTAWLEKMWRDPDFAERMQRGSDEHRERMADYAKMLEREGAK